MSTVPSLEALTRLADPLADRTVAAIVGAWGGASQPGADAIARLATATRLMAQWRNNASLADWQPAPGSADPALVETLRAYLREGCRLPVWMDPARVARAEAIFMHEGPLSCTLLFCASLPECYVPPQLAEVLHVAGQLEAHTEHRIRQTAAMVFPVMLKGGLTDPAGSGIAQVLKVRLIHATIRHLILHGDPEQMPGAVAAQPPAGGPSRAPPEGARTKAGASARPSSTRTGGRASIVAAVPGRARCPFPHHAHGAWPYALGHHCARPAAARVQHRSCSFGARQWASAV